MEATTSLLPKEAVALVQHIELNKAGWWNKAIHRLVLAAVWIPEAPPNAQAIAATLEAIFKLKLSAPRLATALTYLESQRMLLRLPNETYRIPDAQRLAFEQEIVDSEEVEARAKGLFCKLVSELGEQLDPEQIWLTFKSDFLGPLIKQMKWKSP